MALVNLVNVHHCPWSNLWWAHRKSGVFIWTETMIRKSPETTSQFFICTSTVLGQLDIHPLSLLLLLSNFFNPCHLDTDLSSVYPYLLKTLSHRPLSSIKISSCKKKNIKISFVNIFNALCLSLMTLYAPLMETHSSWSQAFLTFPLLTSLLCPLMVFGSVTDPYMEPPNLFGPVSLYIPTLTGKYHLSSSFHIYTEDC